MARISVLQSYADHGSVSYGELSAMRLLEIIRGAAPEVAELPCLEQAFLEMPGYLAHDLAAEIGLSHADLDARVEELLGEGLPE